jgi:F-box/leucine-rich repeat protein 2/20
MFRRLPRLNTVSLTAGKAGRNPNDNRRYRRRITRLRHLSLSSRTLLTDIACSHLAYAMPQLFFLELGRVGGDLKDDGIVRLLETLPNLRKLDLEDAIEITDSVLYFAPLPRIHPPSASSATCAYLAMPWNI